MVLVEWVLTGDSTMYESALTFFSLLARHQPDIQQKLIQQSALVEKIIEKLPFAIKGLEVRLLCEMAQVDDAKKYVT